MIEQPVNAVEYAKVVAALARTLTRLEQTTVRLAFAGYPEDDRLVEANREHIQRVRGWLQA